MSSPPSDNTESEILRYQRRLVDLALQRTRQSAERCYQNAERTLSVWIRTALGLMVFGIAIDRFGLVFRNMPKSINGVQTYPEALSKTVAVALVGGGVLVAVVSGIRFYAYARLYSRDYPIPALHQPTLTSFFAMMVACFGLFLFSIMLFFIGL